MDTSYVLITGATSGIGYQLALVFAKNKYNLIIVARREDELEATRQVLLESNVKVICIKKDLSVRSDVFALCKEIESHNVRVDILVNNVGQGIFGKFSDTDINRELAILDLNIGSHLILTKYFLCIMINHAGGKILNVGSIAGKLPGPWQAVYHATKAFIISFSEALREELKGSDITVTVLMPGATDTDFFNKAGMQQSKLVQNKGSLADPAKVAAKAFDALMEGKNRIIYGIRNKAEVYLDNILPDRVVAHKIYEQQKPV